VTARLLLEYDGSGFAGWATQPRQRTVQEVVEEALAKRAGAPLALTVAGRTDAGVHARGQVCSHPGAPISAGSLNAALPRDVRVLASEPALDGFDARHDAVSRTYRYRVYQGREERVFERGRALRWRYALDPALLPECAALLTGTHDFTAFTPTRTKHSHFDRTIIRAEWLEEPDGVHAFWIEADAFLRGMVRALVGTMLTIAAGRMEVAQLAALLEGGHRADAGDGVASHGLYLESVRY
jgi:tRNA pseudouridine38-40 synthase